MLKNYKREKEEEKVANMTELIKMMKRELELRFDCLQDNGNELVKNVANSKAARGVLYWPFLRLIISKALSTAVLKKIKSLANQ